MSQLKGVGIGAGYFSHFHYDAWSRIPEVNLEAVCDLEEEKANVIKGKYGIPKTYSNYMEMIDVEKPDFVDVITPPSTHLDLCRNLAEKKIHCICQKPLAPFFKDAEEIVRLTEHAGIRFCVHENWRFQPWYREIKKLISNGEIEELHSITFRSRMGDGWGKDAYLSRQPYFRDYPRLLVYETGVHFIDTYRYLAGEIKQVYCRMRKLNPVIAGEDRCLILFEFENGAEGIWDANRYNESNCGNPRYTFGECLVEGTGGTIRLYLDGKLTVQQLGKPETIHEYFHENRGFAGDCCYFFQRHFVDRMLDGNAFETSGIDYLKTLSVQEAVYHSAENGNSVNIGP